MRCSAAVGGRWPMGEGWIRKGMWWCRAGRTVLCLAHLAWLPGLTTVMMQCAQTKASSVMGRPAQPGRAAFQCRHLPVSQGQAATSPTLSHLREG